MEVQGTPSSPHMAGIKGFLQNNTAGMPNWVWFLVIGGGIAAAIIGKKFFSKSTGNATTTGSTPDSGLGLAIDPTTGLPYAVEGLVPSGGTVGGTTGPGNETPPPLPTPTPTPIPLPQPSPFPFPMPTGTGGEGDTEESDTGSSTGGHPKKKPKPHHSTHQKTHKMVTPKWPGGTIQIRSATGD